MTASTDLEELARKAIEALKAAMEDRGYISDAEDADEAFVKAITPQAILTLITENRAQAGRIAELEEAVKVSRGKALEEAEKIAGHHYRQWSNANGFEGHTSAARIIRDEIRAIREVSLPPASDTNRHD